MAHWAWASTPARQSINTSKQKESKNLNRFIVLKIKTPYPTTYL
jgi:hypothetical protein